MPNKSQDSFSMQRASCKQWSAFLAVVILLAGGFGKASEASLFLAALPIVLLGLTDAAYVAQHQSVCPNPLQANDGLRSAIRPFRLGLGTRMIGALFSLSIWPFYFALLGLVAVGAFGFSQNAVLHPNASAPGSQTYRKTVLEPARAATPLEMMPQQATNGFAVPLQAVPGRFTPRTTPAGFRRQITPVNYAAKPVAMPASSPPTGGTSPRSQSLIPPKQDL